MGEGDEPGGDGENDEPGADGEAEGAAFPDDVAEGAPDWTTEGEGDAGWDCDAAGDGDPLSAAPGETLGDAVRAIGEGLVVWPPGPRATGRGWAANTAAPSATSPRIATSGTSATRRPSGRRSKQFGQKPETGVVT